MKRRTFLALTASLAMPIAMPCVAHEAAQYDELAAVRLIEDMDENILDSSKPHFCWTSSDVAAVWGIPEGSFREWLESHGQTDECRRAVDVNGKLWLMAFSTPAKFQAALQAELGVTLQRAEESSINRRFRAHVKRQMAKRGFSLHGLARKIEASVRYLADVLDGQHDASCIDLLRIAEALQLHPADLLKSVMASNALQVNA